MRFISRPFSLFRSIPIATLEPGTGYRSYRVADRRYTNAIGAITQMNKSINASFEK